MMHLEDRLQEIYFKSKMMAEYLKGTKHRNMKELIAMLGYVLYTYWDKFLHSIGDVHSGVLGYRVFSPLDKSV